MSQRVHVSATTNLRIPSNGVGGVCTFRTASASGTTTYTDTTVADSGGWGQNHGGNVSGGIGSVVAGDIIVTQHGFWATVLSVAANTITIAPVPGLLCGWRHMTDPKQDGAIPASSGSRAAAVYSASNLAGMRAARAGVINRVHVTTNVAADWTITLADGFGTTLLVPAIAVRNTAPATPGTPEFAFELPFRGPFSVQHNNATPVTVVEYDYIG